MPKLCQRCHFVKAADQFGCDRQKADKLTSYCLLCKSELNAQYHERNKEWINKRDRRKYWERRSAESGSTLCRDRRGDRTGRNRLRLRLQIRIGVSMSGSNRFVLPDLTMRFARSSYLHRVEIFRTFESVTIDKRRLNSTIFFLRRSQLPPSGFRFRNSNCDGRY